MSRHIFILFMIVAIVSFLGFCVENIWLSITKGYMDNRNMHLPFLLGYGLAMIAIFLIFGTPKSPNIFGYDLNLQGSWLCTLTYWGIVFLCVSVGEIILGTAVEKMFGIVWWNYSRLPLHITKYTSVPTSSGFSLMITFFMGYLFEPIYHSFASWNDSLLMIVACVLMIGMVMDFIYSTIWMVQKHELLVVWKLDFTNSSIYKRTQFRIKP